MYAVWNSFAENMVEKKTHPKMGRKFPRQQKRQLNLDAVRRRRGKT
jgi:hypothetical protein